MNKTVFCTCGQKAKIGQDKEGALFMVCVPCEKVTPVQAHIEAHRKLHYNNVLDKHSIADEPRLELSNQDLEILALWDTKAEN